MPAETRSGRKAGSEQSAADFAVDLARAFAGALLFSLPILMTMEMWWFGFYMDPLRLMLLWALTFPLIVRLSRYGGLRHTGRLRDDVADALVAVAVAVITSAVLLWMFGVLAGDMSIREMAGKISLQAAPASFGAMLASNQLGSDRAKRDLSEGERTYPGELFLMIAGALFLSLNVAATEEVMLIAYQMSVWQEIGLVVGTLIVMHGFAYSVEFRGTVERHPAETFWSTFARFTVVGYALVLVVSLYVLWTFERIDGLATADILAAVIVLAFPAAIGAAAARMIL